MITALKIIFCHPSTEERTTLPDENIQSDESRPTDHDGGTKTEDAEDMKESVEKNEEKSGDQEKEE